MGKSYGKALDELDQLHRAGKISDARYELHKAKLTSEAVNGTASWFARLATWVAIGVGALIVLLIIGSFIMQLIT
jgi:hypothetical protein